MAGAHRSDDGSDGGFDGDLLGWSATETAARVRRREVRAVDVIDAHLARLEAINPHLNAVTRVNEDAREAAAAVDRALEAGDAGADLLLAGVPVTIKDNVDVAGQTTPNGVAALDEQTATADAPLVEHLRAAGAIVIGRTNTPEFSWRWHTDNPLFGATRNPWGDELTPGGSSGGAAAALAAGIGCIAQGNDAGGSVRWPANCTGLTGLRPTVGTIASNNTTAAGERPLGIEYAATQGPLARSVQDCRLMFEVMAQGSARDPSYVPAQPQRAHRRRVGWHLGAGAEPHPDIVVAVAAAADGLVEQGWTASQVELPDLAASARDWASLINTDFHTTNRAAMLELGSPAIAAMLEAFDRAGSVLDVAGLYRVLGRRATQLRAWQQLLTDEVDVVVLPVTMEPVWPAGDDISSPARLDEIFAANTPLVAFNFLGLPALAQPTGVVDGRPVGVQIVARRFAEHVALDAAEAIESTLGLFTPHR